MDEFTDDIILAFADFLDSVDLTSFARSSKRFGLQKDELGLSLVDRVATQKVSRIIANHDGWKFSDALKKKNREGWPSVLNRLERVTSDELNFHRFIGNGIDFLQNDTSHVEIHRDALGSGDYPLGSSIALCNKVMTEGKHHAKFTVMSEGYMQVGVLRPCLDWDCELKTMHPKGSKDYRDHCDKKTAAYEGDVHWYLFHSAADSLGRVNFLKAGDRLLLGLDLDEGKLEVFKNGSMRCVNYGFRGHYCWAVSITNAFHRAGIRVQSVVRRELSSRRASVTDDVY